MQSDARQADWQSVHAQLRELARKRAGLDAEEARRLREAERLRIWRELGQPTMIAYLEHTLGYAPRTAFDRMRVARALGDLPGLEHALANGLLSYCAVRELVRVAAPHTEDAWIEAATGAPLRDVEEMVRGREVGDLPDSPSKPDLVKRTITLEVSPETYALYRQAQTLARGEADRPLDEDAVLRMMCRTFIEGGASERTRASHQIATTLCESCKRAWHDAGGKRIEVEAKTLEKAMCDAEHVGSLDDKAPARSLQDVTPRMREFILRRDRGCCRIPGCRSSRHLEVHHIIPKLDGGSNDASNLILCCTGHHDAIHDGLIVVTGSADRLVVERSERPSAAAVVDTARRALVKMGFREKEARALVDEATAHVGTHSLQDVIRESLRCSKTPG